MRLSVYDRPRLNISNMVPVVHNVRLTQCVIADQEKAECVVYANEPALADIPLEYQDVKPEGWWPAGARTSGGKRFVVIRGEVTITDESITTGTVNVSDRGVNTISDGGTERWRV